MLKKLIKISMFFASLFNFLEAGDTYRKNQILMDKILNHSIKQLSSRYGVHAIGIGHAESDKKSKMEGVSFTIYKKISKEEARILLVEIVELFLHNINNTPEIASYLFNNPFTYKNLDFVIFIHNKDDSRTYYPDMGVVSITRGIVTFNTYEPGKLCKYFTDEEETYEEAYKIATQGKQ